MMYIYYKLITVTSETNKSTKGKKQMIKYETLRDSSRLI